MSSSISMTEADRPRAVDTETFLRHVLKSHSDRLYDLPEDISDGPASPSTKCGRVQSYDGTE